MRRPLCGLVLVGVALTVAGCTSVPAPATNSARPHAAVATVRDTWVHHFDVEAAAHADSPVGAAWGSFGPKNAVSRALNTFASVPAGSHTVVVECAGPTTVTVIVRTTGSGDPGQSHNMTCPASSDLRYTTTGEGIDVFIDSHGQQGAWLIDVTS